MFIFIEVSINMKVPVYPLCVFSCALQFKLHFVNVAIN